MEADTKYRIYPRGTDSGGGIMVDPYLAGVRDADGLYIQNQDVDHTIMINLQVLQNAFHGTGSRSIPRRHPHIAARKGAWRR